MPCMVKKDEIRRSHHKVVSFAWNNAHFFFVFKSGQISAFAACVDAHILWKLPKKNRKLTVGHLQKRALGNFLADKIGIPVAAAPKDCNKGRQDEKPNPK